MAERSGPGEVGGEAHEDAQRESTLSVAGQPGLPVRNGRERALDILQDGTLITEDGAQALSQAVLTGILDGSVGAADAKTIGEVMMGTLLPTLAMRRRAMPGGPGSRQLRTTIEARLLLEQVEVFDGPLAGQQVREIIDGECS